MPLARQCFLRALTRRTPPDAAAAGSNLATSAKPSLLASSEPRSIAVLPSASAAAAGAISLATSAFLSSCSTIVGLVSMAGLLAGQGCTSRCASRASVGWNACQPSCPPRNSVSGWVGPTACTCSRIAQNIIRTCPATLSRDRTLSSVKCRSISASSPHLSSTYSRLSLAVPSLAPLVRSSTVNSSRNAEWYRLQCGYSWNQRTSCCQCVSGILLSKVLGLCVTHTMTSLISSRR
mmetsp:Transcript_11030/g.27767  ORF Transcript_11030/g.27767 Transcript_11030/m.27767 type:complete len:235 (-) Transcript_11030:698-1402(-)